MTDRERLLDIMADVVDIILDAGFENGEVARAESWQKCAEKLRKISEGQDQRVAELEAIARRAGDVEGLNRFMPYDAIEPCSDWLLNGDGKDGGKC
jgi:hypothetical protein